MWQRLEPLHAVTYFAPESIDALKATGLKGFWMSYFAGRSAPMGAVSAAVVEATFYNFSPQMVRRAIPDAWTYAAPAEVLQGRLEGVDRSLRPLLETLRSPPDLAEAAGLVAAAVEGLDVAGRPLAAANLALESPPDPLLALWQGTTVLREHRGDGHLSALVEAELDACQAHVSFAATGATPRQVLQRSRGWTDEEWAAATESLRERGLMTTGDRLSADGLALRRTIEADTDRLAAKPWRTLGTERTERLATVLKPLLVAIGETGIIPVLNPMGLRDARD
jgi:hypothetical protein